MITLKIKYNKLKIPSGGKAPDIEPERKWPKRCKIQGQAFLHLHSLYGAVFLCIWC